MASKQVAQTGSLAISAKGVLAPFAGTIPDVVMVDKDQARFFSVLGQTRSPFAGVANWPTLDERLRQHSAVVRQQLGEDQWLAAGGTLDTDGKPTCRPASEMAATVVQQISSDPGGLLWSDNDRIIWAVRLVPAPYRDNALYGFAVSWHGDGRLLDPMAQPGRPGASKRPRFRSDRQRLATARSELAIGAGRLRLVGRAEQMLWLIHQAVMMQRNSVVLLPDVMLGQVIWGGARKQWPQDWRREVLRTLKSLTFLRSEVFRLSGAGWCPQFGAHSVAVSYVEQLDVTHPEEDYCRPCCWLWNSTVRHHHLLVQIGYGFLGVLEKFAASGADAEPRTYDFNKSGDDEDGNELKEVQQTGQIITVSSPTAILGPAKWSGLTETGVRIFQALIGEVTRPERGKARRPDKGEVFTGNMVPGLDRKSSIRCPLLRPEDRYVAFGGNGGRRGMGYTIAGGDGQGGWLAKCGYVTAGNKMDLLRSIRSFLRELGDIAKIMGLIVTALEPGTARWLSLADLIHNARHRQGLPTLLRVHLRVYGREDYLARCRDHFARQGKFAEISGAGVPSTVENSNIASPLAVRIQQAGIRQVELARLLRISQPRVSQLVNSARPWPRPYQRRVEELIARRLGESAVEEAAD